MKFLPYLLNVFHYVSPILLPSFNFQRAVSYSDHRSINSTGTFIQLNLHRGKNNYESQRHIQSIGLHLIKIMIKFFRNNEDSLSDGLEIFNWKPKC